MTFSIMATVNYPEQKEVDTPRSELQTAEQLQRWFTQLVNEPDWISFVVVVTKHN